VSNSDECTFILPHNGAKYTEFSCLYPGFERFYFDWEKKYFATGGYKIFEFISGDSLLATVLPSLTVCVYLVAIFAGKRYMRDRKPWQWRNQLAVWNFCLSIFSFWGMIRLLPPIIHYIKTLSLYENICGDAYGRFVAGTSGVWIQFFTLSKFPELIDTFFIIIHKKPLMFLHYYHHISVLLYVWHAAYGLTNPVSPVFAAMNYGVHAMMYGYYFLMAINMKPKWMNPMYITAAQILQMIAGIVATAVGIHFFIVNRLAVRNGMESTCTLNGTSLVAATLMYGSYLILFVQFFMRRFFAGKRINKKLV